MLTSLDWEESRNFFSHPRIKFLEVECRKCHLSYAYSMFHAANDAKRVIAWPWRLDDWLGIAEKDCGNCLWSPSLGWPLDVAVFYNIALTGVCLRCQSSQLLKHCWVHASTVSCRHTAAVPTQFHCTASDCDFVCLFYWHWLQRARWVIHWLLHTRICFSLVPSSGPYDNINCVDDSSNLTIDWSICEYRHWKYLLSRTNRLNFRAMMLNELIDRW